mmetsp:Transcript_21318/g.67373  ORF Transcript_21318/g.67373 Transcript_21318/m.67373 type:complete len:364 (+) Transcript_21318:92-1183(+)
MQCHDVACLAARLHREALFLVTSAVGRHVEGLHQGVALLRGTGLSARAVRRLREVEVISGFTRHVTQYSVENVLAEIRADLKEAAKVYEERSGQAKTAGGSAVADAQSPPRRLRARPSDASTAVSESDFVEQTQGPPTAEGQPAGLQGAEAWSRELLEVPLGAEVRPKERLKVEAQSTEVSEAEEPPREHPDSEQQPKEQLLGKKKQKEEAEVRLKERPGAEEQPKAQEKDEQRTNKQPKVEPKVEELLGRTRPNFDQRPKEQSRLKETPVEEAKVEESHVQLKFEERAVKDMHWLGVTRATEESHKVKLVREVRLRAVERSGKAALAERRGSGRPSWRAAEHRCTAAKPLGAGALNGGLRLR